MTGILNFDDLKQSGKATGTFYFKQFKVEDGKSTMKVGTDAVLLGAAADVGGAGIILEIGTGSGVIALILAQRSTAMIDAIEIDEESAKQAGENTVNSPWAGRINIIHSSLQEFTRNYQRQYDLIVSNPPFFSCSLKSPDRKRNISRHDETLSYEDLASCSTGLMAPGASFWVILPFKESEVFTGIAKAEGLFPCYRLVIIPKEGRPGHRCILQFKRLAADTIEEKTLVILDGDGKHTQGYRELTKELYIDF
jgi:tRNA1Val (adenine37-N6)-methyltransferase